MMIGTIAIGFPLPERKGWRDRLRDFISWAITHATATRNAISDAVDAHINTGGGTAVLKIRQSTTDLVSFNLQNPAFGASSSGTITLAGVPIAATAGAAGTADGFQILDRGGALVLSGSVTGNGGGGDIEVSNTSIANGQSCSLTALTYTAPT